MTKLPQLQHRKDRDLAFISIKRKKIYLGKWVSPEVFIEYAKIISGGEIIKKSADEKPGTKQEPKKKTSVQDFIVNLLSIDFLKRERYRHAILVSWVIFL
ncbi:MAG: hypothetical protein IKE69_13470 [Thermoguttaceae bacterium]|nr:hypothetical protein [Thermoguttaceae bacterium]